jgi:hypothetical protein
VACSGIDTSPMLYVSDITFRQEGRYYCFYLHRGGKTYDFIFMSAYVVWYSMFLDKDETPVS